MHTMRAGGEGQARVRVIVVVYLYRADVNEQLYSLGRVEHHRPRWGSFLVPLFFPLLLPLYAFRDLLLTSYD